MTTMDDESDSTVMTDRRCDMRKSELKVRKVNGVYRVYCYYKRVHYKGQWYEKECCRYGKLVDAKDRALREGGYVYYMEFEDKERALQYLAERLGEMWW